MEDLILWFQRLLQYEKTRGHVERSSPREPTHSHRNEITFFLRNFDRSLDRFGRFLDHQTNGSINQKKNEIRHG